MLRMWPPEVYTWKKSPMSSTMICHRIGKIISIALAALPGLECREKLLASPARSTFTPWRPSRNIWGKRFLLSGLKKIGSYQIDPESPAVLTGVRQDRRKGDLLPSEKGLHPNHVQDRERIKSREPSARSQRSEVKGQRTDDRGQRTEVRGRRSEVGEQLGTRQ